MILDETLIDEFVYTRDGDALGTVKEIRGGYFKLDVPSDFDYWLPETCVESVDADGIHLEITHAELEPYRMGEPDQAP